MNRLIVFCCFLVAAGVSAPAYMSDSWTRDKDGSKTYGNYGMCFTDLEGTGGGYTCSPNDMFKGGWAIPETCDFYLNQPWAGEGSTVHDSCIAYGTAIPLTIAGEGIFVILCWILFFVIGPIKSCVRKCAPKAAIINVIVLVMGSLFITLTVVAFLLAFTSNAEIYASIGAFLYVPVFILTIVGMGFFFKLSKTLAQFPELDPE